MRVEHEPIFRQLLYWMISEPAISGEYGYRLDTPGQGMHVGMCALTLLDQNLVG